MTRLRVHRLRTVRMLGLTVVLVLSALPAHAQVLVFDPGILVQLVRQWLQAQRQLDQATAARLIWQQLARPLPDGHAPGYVIPPTLWSMSRGADDLDPFALYPSVRRAIEQGDPTGLQWRRAVIPLATYPANVLARLTPAQRLHITREYTHPLTSDGLGIMGIHALAYNREGHLAASRAAGRLAARLHADDPGNVGLHQTLAAAEVLAAREEHLRNVYLAYLVEDAVADLKRVRDAQTRRLHSDLFRRVAGPTVTAQTTAHMERVLADAWRTGR